MTRLLTSYLTRYVTAYLVLLLALSSCADSAEQEPEPRIPAQYALTDVRYFLRAGDHIDTVVVALARLRVQNTSNTLTTQHLNTPVDDFVKTSPFALDPTTALPQEVDLSTVAIQVPEQWYGGELFAYFAGSFSLHPDPQQQPYGPYAQQRLTLTVPLSPGSTSAGRPTPTTSPARSKAC